MNINKLTLGLAAVGAVSLASVSQADEAKLVPLMTDVSSTTLSGYVDTSAIYRPGTGSDAAGVGRVFDVTGPGGSKQDGFNLNVVSLTLDKPLDEGKWSAGYHVQTLIGPDAATHATGLMNDPNGEVALNEAYVSLRAPIGNGLDIKMGQFAKLVGYETFDSYLNPNYSRSYGYYLEPSSHVGATAKYTVASWLSVEGGAANSYGYVDARAADESVKTYLGKVVLTAPDSMGPLKDSTLTLAYTGGAPNYGGIGTPQEHIEDYYVGAKIMTPIKELTVGAAFDYQDSQGPLFARTLAGYVTYEVTPNFKLGGRADWAEGNTSEFINTANIAAIGTPAATALAAAWANPSSQVNLLGLTLTGDYSLWANVTTRAEVRWDHSIGGGTAGDPFNNANPTALQHNELTLALNVIYKF